MKAKLFYNLNRTRFNPKKQSGLVMWNHLNSAYSTLDASGNPIEKSFSQVGASQWTDWSGNNYHWIGDASHLPLTRGVDFSNSSLDFFNFGGAGVVKRMSIADQAALRLTNFHLFVVGARYSSLANVGHIIGKWDQAANNRGWRLAMQTDFKPQAEISANGSSTGFTAKHGTALSTSRVVMEASFNGTTLIENVNNGTQVTSSPSGLFASTAPLYLGAREGFNDGFDGQLWEIRLYNRVLATGERRSQLNDLSDFYGITIP